MSDSADLICFDCVFGLELGWFWNVADPRYIFAGDKGPSSQVPDLSRAPWRMLAEHIYHDLRLVGEQGSHWDELDPDVLRTVGGDLRVGGIDPTVEEYVDGWPIAAPPAPDGLDFARLACLGCGIVLPLGSLRDTAEPGASCIVDAEGRPAFEQVEVNRAVWKMFADHVYHQVRVIGRRSPLLAQVDQPAVVVIGGDRAGVDPTIRDYLGDWPG